MRIFVLLIFCVFFYSGFGQNKIIEEQINHAKTLIDTIFLADNPDSRLEANQQFIPLLVNILKTENSFFNKLDSLNRLAIVYSPDNLFRIITWHVLNEVGTYQHHGCIQHNHPTLKLSALKDKAPLLGDAVDTILQNANWWGAMYYEIVPLKFKKINYYTLLGWSANELFSQKKVVDVLSFDKKGNPVFGAPIFKNSNSLQMRMIFEYSKRATMGLRYIESEKKIVADHLIVPHGPDIGVNRVPDGTYTAWIWKRGKWVYQDNADLRNKSE